MTRYRPRHSSLVFLRLRIDCGPGDTHPPALPETRLRGSHGTGSFAFLTLLGEDVSGTPHAELSACDSLSLSLVMTRSALTSSSRYGLTYSSMTSRWRRTIVPGGC